MALENMTKEELASHEEELLGEVVNAGGRVGNTTLLRTLDWDEATYWGIRDRLVDQGRLELGRGKGGSVRLVRLEAPAPNTDDPEVPGLPTLPVVPVQGPSRGREFDLYEPVAEVLRTSWARDKRYRDLIVEATALQGKRDTGGKWTRPDITVASMTTLLYVPGKLFEVITFELKPSNAIDVTAVYEALAHRRAATRSYVWLHLPPEDADRTAIAEALLAIQSEAKRYGIGVIAASDPADYETWEELVDAARHEPDPEKLNDFIAVQFSAGNKDELLRWMR